MTSEEIAPTKIPPTKIRSAERRGFTAEQWSLLLVLAAVNFTHILDFVIVMPLGDQLRHQLEITPAQFSAVVSAYGLAAMIVGIASSTVVDRFDRKTVLITAFGGFVVATFYCGLSKSYAQLLIARCLTGLFGGVAASTVMAIIGDAFLDHQRGKAIGVVTSSFAVASIVGLPIGLWLSILFKTWTAAFHGIGLVATVVFFIAVWKLPSFSEHRKNALRNPALQFAAVVRQKNHLLAFAMMLATVLGTFTIVPFIAPFLQANCGRSAEDLPIIYAVAGLCTLVSLNIVGWGTDRYGARRLFMFCAGGAVIMTLVITNLPYVSLASAVVVTTFFMVLASGRSVPAQAMMLQASDPSLRGAFMTLNTSVTHLGTALGPLITGLIVGETEAGGQLTHFAIAGAIAAAFGCTAIALSTFLGRYRPT
jgi:predicted MFS family arabinose efflux permease